VAKQGRPKNRDVITPQVAERARRMYELRLKGVSITAIAQAFKCTPNTVNTTLQRHIRKEIVPYVEEYREMQKGRLDYLWEKLVNSGKLEKGDPAAINAGVNILRRYAETVGSDAPTKIELNAHVDPREIELRDLIRAAQDAARNEVKAIRAGQRDVEDDDDIQEAEVVDDEEDEDEG
jgi:DNA-binding CsgD family transcriptional regulator